MLKTNETTTLDKRTAASVAVNYSEQKRLIQLQVSVSETMESQNSIETYIDLDLLFHIFKTLKYWDNSVLVSKLQHHLIVVKTCVEVRNVLWPEQHGSQWYFQNKSLLLEWKKMNLSVLEELNYLDEHN